MIDALNDFDVSDENYGIGLGFIFTTRTPGDAVPAHGDDGALNRSGNGTGNGESVNFSSFRLNDGDGDGSFGSAFEVLACPAPELLEAVAINLVCRMRP